MGFRSLLSRPFAAYVVSKHRKACLNPGKTQKDVFDNLILNGKKTQFGKEHNFDKITSPADFASSVPTRDYEGIAPYIEKVLKGERDILWPGKPTYLAKTSGTTSGVKYIPITKDSLPNHINGARDALMHHVYHTGKARFLDGKMIFLSGSPELTEKNGIKIGRLSGIVNHHVPAILRINQLPTWETNCIEDWETKVEKIVDETIHQPMSLVSGIPPWVQMYFDRLQARTGKTIAEIFPKLDLFVYGGVNFEPYKRKLFSSLGKRIPTLELFPASEGFIAFQDKPDKEGMLLQLDSGIFFEFIPFDELGKPNPSRLTIDQVELGKVYSLIVSNNAGLWAYTLGDLVRFTSLAPPRVVVAGRTSHYISAFGEHVIAEEVERAMKSALEKFSEVSIGEFTVAPLVSPEDDSQPRHQWFIEFAALPANLPAFNRYLDEQMQKQNIYYKDLLEGNILEMLEIISLPKGSFSNMMKEGGKLGGQNKVPRLANNRNLAEKLIRYQNSW